MTIHRDEDKASPIDLEEAVRSRYGAASQAVEPALCCPVDYDARYLEVLPQEILDRDYGCGDPSAHVREGDVVLDLGSGAGKICFIASQVVGPRGRVIGVDMTDDMLALARQHRAGIAAKIGWDNVEFRKGRIQDLRTDLEQVEARLADMPVSSVADLQAFEGWKRRFEAEPMIPDDSVDVVVSNCVLNLVENVDKPRLFAEIFRVLKKGGRAAISDIVADEPVPKAMQDDPELWSGCISGALTEEGFLRAFEDAGFHGIAIEKWDDEPWQVVQGIQFRSVTVVAWKGKQGPSWDHKQAVLYKGPYKAVVDDDGHTFVRGQRVAVCEKTFGLLQAGPYAEHFAFIEPLQPVAAEHAEPFPCTPQHHAGVREALGDGVVLRSVRETKGEGYAETVEACGGGSCC